MNRYILFVLCSALSLYGCKSGRLEKNASDTLSLAIQNVEFVDNDQEAQNQLRLKLARQAARSSDFQLAMYTADQIRGALRGTAFGMLAWDAANRGFFSRANEAIHIGEQDHWISSDSESGLKKAYLAGALERMGREREASAHVQGILDPNMHHLANALRETARIARNPSICLLKKGIFVSDTVLESVQGMVPVLEDSEIGLDRKKQLLEMLQVLVGFTDPANRVDCLSQIAVACGKINMFGDAALMARQASEFAEAFDPRLETYAIGLSQTSLAFSAAKEKSEAERCLELAAARPQLVALYFQPQAIYAIALGYSATDEPEKAKNYWLKGLRIAKSHPHPRARQMNVVFLLSSMAEAGVEPWPEITAVIEEIKRGEGGDAPLPPGYVKVGDTKTNAATVPSKQDKKEKRKKQTKVPAA